MIETYKRDAKYAKLGSYCMFAGDNDSIEILEWKNGEGVDVYINGSDVSEYFSLTHGQMKALMALYNYEADDD